MTCSSVNFYLTFTFNWRFFVNRGTVKVLALPTCVCVCVCVCVTHTYTHTHTRVYIEIEVTKAYQKACCRSCIKFYLVNRNVNTNQSRAWRNNCRSYQKCCCAYFIQLWVISENIWPSAVGSRFAWKLHWTKGNLRLKNETDKNWSALQ
jgi:hypothetical protein